MDFIFFSAGIVLGVCFLILTISFICFLRVFYFRKRKKLAPDEFEIPKGRLYEVFREDMIRWMKMTRTYPHEKLEVKSFDGLTLRGRYYECKPGAPIELQFHGYEGNAERDLSGGVERCFALDRNVILIDQRASGESDGHIVSFGINERRDCLSWIYKVIERFGDDVKIIITGISMGGATVLMTAGEVLPKNVICVLGDCPYSSAKEILLKVIKDMGLPSKLVYPFVKLGARIFGRFDLEETSPIEAMERCKIPVILVHGDNDKFVPFEMSERMFEKCASEKKTLIKIEGAGHGLAYPVARDKYITELKRISEEWGL